MKYVIYKYTVLYIILNKTLPLLFMFNSFQNLLLFLSYKLRIQYWAYSEHIEALSLKWIPIELTVACQRILKLKHPIARPCLPKV